MTDAVNAKVSGIGRLDAEEQASHEARENEGRSQTSRDANGGNHKSLTEHESENRSRRRAQRDADAQFSRALADEVRHHAVDADRGEDEARVPRTAPSSTIENRRRTSDSSMRLDIVPHVGDRQIGIERADVARHCARSATPGSASVRTTM